MVTLIIGSQSTRPGELVDLPVSLDTQGELVRSFQVNLSFSGAGLLDPSARAGPALPLGWSFSQNSPEPGDLRFLTLDLSGGAARTNGVVVIASFRVAPGAMAGTTLTVSVALQEVIGEGGAAPPVTVQSGGVTVLPAAAMVVSPPSLVTVTEPPPPPPPAMVSVLVSPASASLLVSQTQQFSATCTLSDGSRRDCTAEASWSSSNPLVATIAPGGLAIGLGPGVSEIRASMPASP